eukprot:jgi/Mesvir1/11777/Mv00144-RA.1
MAHSQFALRSMPVALALPGVSMMASRVLGNNLTSKKFHCAPTAMPKPSRMPSVRMAMCDNSGPGKKRRRGRPASCRNPDDSPLRDGNRDRLLGLLTDRAAHTLSVYLMETNQLLHLWLIRFMKANPIPFEGRWEDICGDGFLEALIACPPELLDDPFCTKSNHSVRVDPAEMAHRIIDIRAHLALEFIQDLKLVKDEKTVFLQEQLRGMYALPSAEDIPEAEMDDRHRRH